MKIHYYFTTTNLKYGTTNTDWLSQSISFDNDVVIETIRLRGYRVGSPGTVHIEIQDTLNYAPNGTIYARASFNGDNLTDSSEGEIIDIKIDATLDADTEYAIVIYSTGAGANIFKFYSNTVDFNKNGVAYYSDDTGSSWNIFIPYEGYMYQLYGSYTGSKGTKELASRYPVTDGIIAETTTQVGHITNLVPEYSFIPRRERTGL